MKKSTLPDAFEELREKEGHYELNDQDDPVRVVLGHKDVRKTAKNWKVFQSGAEPGRIVVPSETKIRDLRQIPFEVDPPEHKGYRALVEPWFKRPLEDGYQEKLKVIISDMLDSIIAKGTAEIVHDFSLPLQSKALTVLLNMPIEEADRYIGWGTHVFRGEGESLDADKAGGLVEYLDEKVEEKKKNPGDDLFSVLLASEANGHTLSDDEVKGVMMLTFAGGRDTVINTLTNSMAYFADHPESIERLRKEPDIINSAIEELIRYFSPLTHMGRVATEDTEVSGCPVHKDTRVSMAWASANRDPKVFDNPNEVVLDRKVNPHVAFGFGTHNCLGSTHARAIMKVFIEQLTEKIESMEILDVEENIEDLGEVKRKVGFHKINVKINKR